MAKTEKHDRAFLVCNGHIHIKLSRSEGVDPKDLNELCRRISQLDSYAFYALSERLDEDFFPAL